MAKRISILTFMLIAFGLIMISSAGIFESKKDFNSDYYYFYHQLLYGVLPAVGAFLIFSRVPYRYWKKFSLPLLIISLSFLVLIFVPSLGISAKGATRWLNLHYVSFQPAEVFKFTFIIYLASWLSVRAKGINNLTLESIAPLLIVLGMVGFILVAQPDLGTAIVIGGIAMFMFFLANIRLRYITALILVATLLVGGLSVVSPYRLQRLTAFLNPNLDVQGSSYQLNQGLIAIGTGGLFGVGFGKSQQKLGLLPEPITDSIFAIIGEELGLVGIGFLLLLFIWLTFFMFQVAKNTRDSFASFIVSGVASWIIIQVFINVGAISGLLPFTGITLPFISYGGTSLVILTASMGIVVNIAKNYNLRIS
ncbi:MAG: putative lipid II flippase FtsW [Parcubacteria group bacterium]|nr:putative lipid II flippase FtsW [Parcubacteria group bacterium]